MHWRYSKRTGLSTKWWVLFFWREQEKFILYMTLSEVNKNLKLKTMSDIKSKLITHLHKLIFLYCIFVKSQKYSLFNDLGPNHLFIIVYPNHLGVFTGMRYSRRAHPLEVDWSWIWTLQLSSWMNLLNMFKLIAPQFPRK